MKNCLLFTCFVLSIHFVNSQTWIGGGGDNFWNTAANWDSGTVPGPGGVVTIPSPFVVEMDVPGADIQELTIDSGATLTLLGGTFVFSNTVTNNGTFNFNRPITGGGTFTNNGTINLSNVIGTISSSNGATTLVNNGDINLNDIGDIFIQTGCELNNESNGEIFLNSNATGISRSGAAPHVFKNSGKIISNPPLSTDQVIINAQLINNGGTIEVINGTLFLDSNNLGSQFNGGMYKTSMGATLTFQNTALFSGTLMGDNKGTINFRDTIDVTASAVTISIAGTGIINFEPSIIGAGTVTNTTTLNIGGLNVNINDNSTLLNQGTIEFDAAGDIFICSGCTLNNDVTGIIDFKGDTGNIQSGTGGALPHLFLNTGLIKTSFTGGGSDMAQISVDMNNSGTIEVSNGSILLFDNDIQLNGGIYNIGADGELELDLIVTAAGSLAGTIDATGLLKWDARLTVPVAASFDFVGTGIIDWFNGSLDGGGILTNNNVINIGSSANAFIYGGSTLVNNNTINFNSNDDLLIETGGTLNNAATGDINFLADGAQIGVNGVAPRLFDNNGDIFVNLPNVDDDVAILCEFNNNGANIEIQRGVLNLNNGTKDAQNLIGGTYNIFADGAFDWDGNVTLSGALSGTAEGPITWRNSVWVNTPNTANFFFAGTQPTIFWTSGSLNGGGTLINANTVDIASTGTVFINDGCNFRNEGNFRFTTFGDLQLASNGVFDNLVNGTIEMQQPSANISTSGAAPHALNNVGTFIADTGGVNSVAINTNNTGLIDIRSGELEFNSTIVLTNDTNGTIKGNGILDIPSPSNFVNNGTIAPGNSPGTLTILGDYSSTSSAVLEIEIDGVNQGTEFDFIPITGDDVVFNGMVDVTLGFDPDVNDEFVIATTSQDIITCNLQTPTFASFGGFNYEFDVVCRNNNEVVLTVLSETLSAEAISLTDKDIVLYPNPASGYFNLINKGNVKIEKLFLYDIGGRKVSNYKVSNVQELQSFNLNNIPSGFYLLKIESEKGNIVKRLVVK